MNLEKREVVILAPQKRDTIFPHRKLMNTSESNTSETSSDRRKRISYLEAVLKKIFY